MILTDCFGPNAVSFGKNWSKVENKRRLGQQMKFKPQSMFGKASGTATRVELFFLRCGLIFDCVVTEPNGDGRRFDQRTKG